MYFESHAHYDDRRFNEDRDVLLKTLLPEAGVDYVINIGADMKSSQKSIELAEKYDYIYASVGVHPHDAKSIKDNDLNTLEDMCKHTKVVAVGEIGLDFYHDYSDRKTQQKRFYDQLEIVKAVNLPVVIHSRDAAKPTFDIIKESGIQRGVIHCYSGSAEMALDYAHLGFYIAFGGVLTFPTAKVAIDAAAALPIEHILIETDCPYISPEPHRGKRNDSRNLSYICKKLAEIKGLDLETTAKITKENGKKLFFS